MTLAPLNGRYSHPLTDHAWRELERIAREPVPRQELNPGCANRLLRGGFVTQILLRSPYKTHKGKPLAHLSITDFGRERLAKHHADIANAPRRFPVHLKGALTNRAVKTGQRARGT